MDYKANIIKGMTVAELKEETKEMYERQYRYGCSIDRPRLWDILYTIKKIKEAGGNESFKFV